MSDAVCSHPPRYGIYTPPPVWWPEPAVWPTLQPSERHGSHHSTSRALGSPCRVLRHPPAGAELDAAAHSDGPNHRDNGTCRTSAAASI
eukprot:772593-Prymnesium_polylepis.1